MRRSVGLLLPGFAALILSLQSAPARAWGSRGHQLVTAVAIERSPAALKRFFTPNTQRLREMAVVPDNKWKQSATYQQERFHHFYQLDEYLKSPLANYLPASMQEALQVSTVAFLKENGTAVWRSDQMFQMLIDAFRANQPEKILQWAGILSHYIGDLSQPMHVTSDYDGQSIQRRGIHKYFEVDVLEHVSETTLFQDILAASAQTELGNDDHQLKAQSVGSASWATARTHQLAERSLEDLAPVIQTFRAAANQPSDADLLHFSVPEMALGARTLAEMWERAWTLAGAPGRLPTRAVTVADPDFVPFGDLAE